MRSIILGLLLALWTSTAIAQVDTDGDGLDDAVELGGDNPTDPDDPDSDDDDLCDGPNDVDGICVGGEDANADGSLDEGESDPNVADSDGGGTADGREVLVDATDPTDPDDDIPLDTDGDGLPDLVEVDIGTDPDRADTDGDGLPDGVEVNGENATDPTDPDSDDDGLCDGPFGVANTCAQGEDVSADGRRGRRETDPNVADTDGGGVADGREVLLDGTDPLNPDDDGSVDRDQDGLSNRTELDIGTDPDDPDTDGGGLDDGAEVAAGTDPLDPSDDPRTGPEPDVGTGLNIDGYGVRGGSAFACSATDRPGSAPWQGLAAILLTLVVLGRISRRRAKTDA